MKNWWYYHKWYVICGIVLGSVIIYLTGNALGLFSPSPDLQIAYIGETSLPKETVDAAENAFASLAGDYNSDGKVLVQVNQYISGSPEDTSAEAAQYRQAAEIGIIADINDCESYFFLLEDPETFQRQYQVLAMPDGSCPSNTDISVTDKVLPWSDAASLSETVSGDYTISLPRGTYTGSNQELLSGLYLGRRCFYNEKQTDHAEECAVLWNTLKGESE